MENSTNHMSGNTVIDRFVSLIAQVTKWLCIVMVLLQFGIVVARYVFDIGSVMAQETILYLFGTMFMMSLAEALSAERHVRVDMIYHTLGAKTRRVIDGLGIVFFLLPLCCFMLYESWTYVVASWAAQEGSREVSGLPGVYLFKTVILIALTLVILQSLAILYRCISCERAYDA